MIILLTQHVLGWLQFSHGPHGWVVYIQPPHVAAGFGIVRDHLTGWWEVQR